MRFTLWVGLLTGCATSAAAPLPKPASCTDGTLFDAKIMKDELAVLAAPELDGRAPGTTGDTKARAFIEDRFRCLGLKPAGDDGGYQQAFESGKRATANVLGYIEGTDPKVGSDIVIVSAHHDHLGDGHLGANDDASGVVALLAVAQAVQQHGAPHRTILFATFGAEEDGMVGSSFYAKHPAKALPLDHVVQFVELDMVGSHKSADLVAAMGAFKGLGARTLLDKLVKNYPRIHVSAGGKARGSDFAPFCELGVPYTFFWTPDHRCYHETCDTIDRIDLPHMVDISSLAGALVEELGDTELDLAGLRAKRGCGL
jgi:peptidase M28-like protein